MYCIKHACPIPFTALLHKIVFRVYFTAWKSNLNREPLRSFRKIGRRIEVRVRFPFRSVVGSVKENYAVGAGEKSLITYYFRGFVFYSNISFTCLRVIPIPFRNDSVRVLLARTNIRLGCMFHTVYHRIIWFL